MQTSMAPSWKSVKQSSQTWNSLANCVVSISWKFHEYASIHYSVRLLRNTDSHDKNIFCIQGVTRNIPNMFQIISRIIVDLCWEVHENPFIHFTVMLVTNTPPGLDGRPLSSIVKLETVSLIISCVVSDIWISVHPFSMVLLTNTDH